MNFKQTVQYALQHSLDYDTVKKLSYIADIKSRNSFYEFLPRLDFDSAHGVSIYDASSTKPWHSNMGLTLSETLYNNGTNLINYDIEHLAQKKADLQLKQKRDQICKNLVSLYLDYSYAHVSYDIAKEENQIIKNQYILIEKTYKQGMKSRDDFIRFKTKLQRSEINLMSFQNAITKYKVQLSEFIGFSLNKESQNLLIDYVPYTPKDINLSGIDNIKIDIKSIYEYKIADFDKKINELDFRLSQRNYYPNVSLTAGIYYTASNYLGYGGVWSEKDNLHANALLNITYNLWDWGILRRKVQIAKYEQDIKTNNIEKSLLSINTQMDKLILDLKNYKKVHLLNIELLQLEKNNFNYIESEYRKGKLSYLNLVESLSNLISAKDQYYSTLYKLANFLYEYSYYQGSIYEKIIME